MTLQKASTSTLRGGTLNFEKTTFTLFLTRIRLQWVKKGRQARRSFEASSSKQEPHPSGAARLPRGDRLVGDVMLAMKFVPAHGGGAVGCCKRPLPRLVMRGRTVKHDRSSQKAAAKICGSNRQLPAPRTDVTAVYPADRSLRLPAILRTVVQQLQARLGWGT